MRVCIPERPKEMKWNKMLEIINAKMEQQYPEMIDYPTRTTRKKSEVKISQLKMKGSGLRGGFEPSTDLKGDNKNGT